MLRYLGYGDRQFGLRPMYVHKRANWEFFAVLKGRCGSVRPDRDSPDFQTRYLWIFSPDAAHGWAGINASACQVAVFHFSNVPNLLERIVTPHGCLGVALDPAQARLVSQTARGLKPHYEHMTEQSLLVFERALLDLSLLILDQMPAARTETKSDFALRKVEAAMTWYLEHMAQQPKLDEISRAVNISVRHLRRLFIDVRNESPQTVFTSLRIHRAMELLAQTEYKLETIAAECGFSSGSDFSRVFKTHRNISPDAWRRSVSNKWPKPRGGGQPR